MPVRSNPMLAIVGNPPPRRVHPLAYEARARYREDLGAGHDAAAEYWRGQAGAFFTENPSFKYGDRVTWSEEALDLDIGRRGQVLRVSHAVSPDRTVIAYPSGRTREANNWELARLDESPVARAPKKKKIKGRKARRNPHEKRKKKPRTKRVSLDEARERFHGFDQAVARYEKFHGNAPQEVEVYYLPDGHDQERVENVHVALHRTIETPYVVPWESNKKGSVWLHEHPEGEDAPLEVLDPDTGTTRKIGGVYVVGEWWES